MGKVKGRPKKFSGPVLCVRVSALAGIRLTNEAQAKAVSISELVRIALERSYGGGEYIDGLRVDDDL